MFARKGRGCRTTRILFVVVAGVCSAENNLHRGVLSNHDVVTRYDFVKEQGVKRDSVELYAEEELERRVDRRQSSLDTIGYTTVTVVV